MEVEARYVGIDVSKARLDVAVWPGADGQDRSTRRAGAGAVRAIGAQQRAAAQAALARCGRGRAQGPGHPPPATGRDADRGSNRRERAPKVIRKSIVASIRALKRSIAAIEQQVREV